MTTRRTFLTTSSLTAMAAMRRGVLRAPGTVRTLIRGAPLGALPRATDPQLKELALRALDAATTAGASYADVRLTTTRRRTFQMDPALTESETLAVGVRALAKGTWGFAAHSGRSPDRVAQLGRQAVEQAQVNTWPWVPPIELIDRPPAAVGNWVMPVKRDPFTVPVEETTDLIQRIAKTLKDLAKNAHRQTSADRGQLGLELTFTFERQERTFASTVGGYTTQTIYTSLGNVPHREISGSGLTISIKSPDGDYDGGYSAPFAIPTGAGYEVLEDAKILDNLPEWLEKAWEIHKAKRFEMLGQYDVVFDGAAMAAIVDGTFGAGLEYDRAVGDESNASGTSYLAPPAKILGTMCAPPSVTITGDRTLPLGAATVGWDDEGVAATPFRLVNEGVVVDYASSREFVAELAPWYQQQGVPARSNGCAASESALTVPLVYTPNLVLHPATRDTSLDALLAGVDTGLLVCGGDVQMDVQQSSGRGRGALVYVIKHGKRAELVKEAVYSFRTRDFWKHLTALGGASTAALRGLATSKGQPNQRTVHSVQAVAARVGKVQATNASST